jgi:phage shock protein PspC (stress-responsive transcriptional regulator)
MTTTTNINLGQRLIVIDTDAHNELSNYLLALKAHFANEPSGDEIYNDIEFRISDIMYAKLKAGRASIAKDDVQEIQDRIGTLEELGIQEATTIAATSDGATANHTSNASSTQAKTQHGSGKIPYTGGKKFQRSEADKFLTGVCAGLARYINVDPLWIRLLAVLLIPTGFSILAYIVLSIVIPTGKDSEYLSKRLMRDVDNKFIGGVCAGAAKYFKTSTLNVRLLFVIPAILIGSFGIHLGFEAFNISFIGLYILLWIIMPAARTSSDKLAMRGQEPTAQSIQGQVLGTGSAETTIKHTGCFGALIIILKSFVLLTLGFVALIVGIVFISSFAGVGSLWLVHDYIFKDGIQTLFALASWLLCLGTPVVAIVYLISRALSGKRKSSAPVMRNFLLAFAAGILCAIYLGFMMYQDFGSNTVSAKIEMPLNYQGDILYVNMDNYTSNDGRQNNFGEFAYNVVKDSIVIPNIILETGASSDTNYHLWSSTSSYGETVSDATKNAQNARYAIRMQDSSVLLPKGYSIQKGNVFRCQELIVKIAIPEGKRVVLNSRAAALPPMRLFTDLNVWNWDKRQADKHQTGLRANVIYEMKNGRLVEVGRTSQFNNSAEIITEGIEEATEQIADAIEDITSSLDDAKDDLREATIDLQIAKAEAQIDMDSSDIADAQRDVMSAQRQVQQLADKLQKLQNDVFEKGQKKLEQASKKASQKLNVDTL